MSSHDNAYPRNTILALRAMLSSRRPGDHGPRKPGGEETSAQHVVHGGPIAYIETTTQQEIFEEDATRMLSLVTDESHNPNAPYPFPVPNEESVYEQP